MVSEARTIELTIVSATDLKNVKNFRRGQRCYAVAYIYASQRQATDADPSGGVNPTWNAPVKLTCYETDLYPDGSASASASSSSSSFSSRAITIDIYSHSSGVFSKGDKLVGTVVVPLQYIASAVKVNGLPMAIDVHRPSGRVQGKLNLTVKLGEKRPIEGHVSAAQQQIPSYAYYDKVATSPMTPSLQTSYNSATGPQSIQAVYHPYSDKLGDQVVTGYPAASYGFSPLGPLPAGNRQQVGFRSYVPQTPLTRKERKLARRARRAAMDPMERRARRKRRIRTGMLIVGGIILALIII